MPKLSMGWVDPRVELGWVRFLAFWWVELGRGSKTFPKILKLNMPMCNLIMIITDK